VRGRRIEKSEREEDREGSEGGGQGRVRERRIEKGEREEDREG
jgi:hypothetical protein